MTNRRAHFREGLSSLYLPFYDALCAELGPEWQPYMGTRTIAQQDKLFAQGRSDPGGRVTNARGGDSAHNYGCGTDWAYFEAGQLVWLKKEDPRWQVFKAAVEKVGLRWGGEFGDVDHAELKLSCDWKHVHLKFIAGGMRMAQEHIAANCIGAPTTVV